ncbi:DUF1700 domain-containing protein [Pediococcus pentosaceus]|uniref:DUF1700 domain-containing protein n=1 Tax=Pediococcus pentosaceus TaxID=1255 RepID=UPI001008AB1B|nr:DUF1700 domain-containing protein [Pediococcus pentosaceus]RXI20922.1 DUF1700 domain-containing protein [Pediococcus pentosaceus]
MNNYIEGLESYLSPLTHSERSDVIQFYTEYLQDSGLTTYQQAVSSLGTPKQLSRKIIADYSIKTDEKDVLESNHPRQEAKTIWLIILAIFSTPITIPLAIVFFASIFGIIVGILFTIFGLGMGFIIFGIMAIHILIAGLTIISGSFWTGVYYIGFAMLIIGIYLVLIPIIKWILAVILHWTSLFFKWLYSKIVTKRSSDEI